MTEEVCRDEKGDSNQTPEFGVSCLLDIRYLDIFTRLRIHGSDCALY
jgi:hypothetical protein